jgi:hypothetical protein
MEHIVSLAGRGKAELTLVGVTVVADALYAMGYFLVDPKREQELMPGAPPFLRLMRAKPYRRGSVFRAETGEKYRSTEPLELDKVHLYAVTRTEELKLERVK